MPEVGMYLFAMARVAHREGYPEIGLYWEKSRYEEAEHALLNSLELLGEVVTDSTKEKPLKCVEAENGATAGKFDLAKRAKPPILTQSMILFMRWQETRQDTGSICRSA